MWHLVAQFHVLNILQKKPCENLKMMQNDTDLSEIRVLRDIVVVSEQGHCFQVLCDVGQILGFSPWIQTQRDKAWQWFFGINQSGLKKQMKYPIKTQNLKSVTQQCSLTLQPYCMLHCLCVEC